MSDHLSPITLAVFICITLMSCFSDKREGLFGRSETIEASIESGSFKAVYIPNKTALILQDGSVINLDTAWAETMGAYDGSGDLRAVKEFGYTVHLPFTGQNFLAFTFALNLLDKSNEAFTNGMSEGYCDLQPGILTDTIAVELWERHPADSIGWTQPTSTDTVLLIRQ
jgi:hypothetical protein